MLQQSKSAVLRTSSTYWSSSLPTGCSPKRNDKVDATEAATNTSALSDISIMLADYLDTGPEGTLDVTPTDLLVGLSVLRLEQQALKEERLAIQSDESKAVKTANGQRAANTSDQQRHTHHREPVGFVNAPFLGYEVDIESGRAVVVAKSVATGSFQGGPTHKVPSLNRECCQSSTQSLIFSRSCSSVQADFSVCLRPRLDRQNASDRAAIFEGLHHVRLAIAIYGYMFYLLQHKCTAPCCLLVGCLNCRPRADESRKRDSHAPQRPTIVGDNSCGCNELTFLHLAGLKREDIAYMSFKSGLQVSPYGIVLDRSRQEVVIAIRGTFSLEATVTDLNVRPQLLGEYSDRYQVFGKDSLSGQYCHSGMLRCALEIFDDLERHKILEQLLLGKIPQCPGYKLVITGHSLGAGIASILSIMLVDQFQGLRCLCFCPPGCVMSLQACEQDYITSYVHGADIVPRLSFHSMVGLCNDILETIARIKEPKHVALALDASRKKASRLPTLLHPRGSIPDSAFYRRICVFRKHQQRIALTRIEYRVQLHIPGVIVHITESLSVAGGKKAESFAHKNPPFTTSYIPMWANRTDFSEIQLTRTMTSDHDAERLFSILKILAASFQ